MVSSAKSQKSCWPNISTAAGGEFFRETNFPKIFTVDSKPLMPSNIWQNFCGLCERSLSITENAEFS